MLEKLYIHNMKVTTFLILILTPGFLYAQTAYKVKAKLGNDTPSKAILSYTLNGVAIQDSLDVKNGEFIFSGQLAEPQRAMIYIMYNNDNFSNRAARKDFKQIYLENATTYINSKDSVKNAKVEGGVVATAAAKLLEKKEPLNNELKAISKEYYAVGESLDSISKKRQEEILNKYYMVYGSLKDLDIAFIKENPANFYSLELINGNLRELSVPKADSLLAGLSSDVKKFPAFERLSSKLNARKSVEIGQSAPLFTAPDTLSNHFDLKSLRGKYVLVDFWASWCGPCRKENPNVVAAFDKYKGKNFTVLGVSLDNPNQKDAWLKAIEKDQLQNWPHVSDLKGWQSDIGKLYAVDAIPQNFLLDPEGIIVATNLREDKLLEKLEELIK